MLQQIFKENIPAQDDSTHFLVSLFRVFIPILTLSMLSYGLALFTGNIVITSSASPPRNDKMRKSCSIKICALCVLCGERYELKRKSWKYFLQIIQNTNKKWECFFWKIVEIDRRIINKQHFYFVPFYCIISMVGIKEEWS